MELESGRVDCGDPRLCLLRYELPVWPLCRYKSHACRGRVCGICRRLDRSNLATIARAKPLWATALFICVGLPGVMTLAQVGVHRLAKTPHQSAGLVTSLCFAAFAAAYTWFAMRQGAMLGGSDATTVRDDLKALPRISWEFLLLAPRQLRAWFK